MVSKHNIVISALADLWTKDILGLIKRGKHKEAISIGVKMGLKKKDLLDIIVEDDMEDVLNTIKRSGNDS